MIDFTVKLKLNSELSGLRLSQTKPRLAGQLLGYFIESNDTARWLEVALFVTADANAHTCGFYPILVEGKGKGVFILVETNDARPAETLGEFRYVKSTPAWVMPMKSIALPKLMSSFQLWIPCESQIFPMPLESDWPLLISGESEWLVWHPAFGLLAMNPLSRLEIESLIMAPEIVRRGWKKAVEGTAIPERLIRVDAPPPPTLEQWLDPSRNGIGDRSDDIVKLPPSQRESQGKPAGNLVAMAQSAIGKTVAWIADRLDGSANGSKAKTDSKNGLGGVATKQKASSSPQWIQDIRNWATNQMQKWNETLEARRESSVNRLLEMLDKNPDEGLRYAIPMSSDPGRGLAPPGSDLVARDLRWGASSSGGVDNWSMGLAAQNRLRNKYIELARRELNDGRYERAASIYVQLLGDYLLAVQALEKGKLYRQAALIHEKRLNNRLKAAEMCTLAGDFDLALEHYQALGLCLEAGELYRRLGQTELATAQFLKHVESLCNQNRVCDAADVLVNKLDRPDSAIELLSGHWPRGSQARLCAKKTFDLLSQLGRHEESIKQIDRLISDSKMTSAGVWSSEFLADLVASYPDASVREHAQRSLFINASQMVRSLQDANSITSVTNSLCRAVPEDRLLQRDARFFVEEKKKAFAKQPKAKNRSLISLPQRGSVTTLAPAKSFSLSQEYQWFGMIPTQRGPLCFGEKDGTLLVQPTLESKAGEKTDGQGVDLGETRSGSREGFRQIARQAETLGEFRYDKSSPFGHAGVEVRSYFGSEDVPRWLRYASNDTRQGEAITVMIGGAQAKAEFGAGTAYWIDNELSYRITPASGDVRDFFYPQGFLNFRSDSLPSQTDYAVFLASHLGQVRLGVRDPLDRVSYPQWSHDVGLSQLEQLVLRGLKQHIGPNDFSDTVFANLVAAEMLSNKWCIAKQESQLLVGCGTQFQVYDSLKPTHSTELSSAIESIRVSNPLTRPRALLGLNTGVLMHWMKADGYPSRLIDDSAKNSHSCFLRTGHIAIAHDSGVDLYSNQGLEVKHVASHSCTSGFADMSADQRAFWTLTKQGLVQKWDLTPFAS